MPEQYRYTLTVPTDLAGLSEDSARYVHAKVRSFLGNLTETEGFGRWINPDTLAIIPEPVKVYTVDGTADDLQPILAVAGWVKEHSNEHSVYVTRHEIQTWLA